MPTHASLEQAERCLLIVQHNPFVVRALARYLAPYYSRVFTACSEREAEKVLVEAKQARVDLVCGLRFGPSQTTGIELISRWRGRHDNLGRVVLATASSSLPEDLSVVDAVFHKPDQPQQLASILLPAA